MACVLIAYDLMKKKDYESLYKAIKSYGTWAHPQDSVWIVKTGNAAKEVRTHLKKHIDSDDKLLCVGLNGAWGTSGHSTNVNDWLKNNL